MVAVGKLLRYDEVRGYGFIAPQDGGEDVFVHANDFGELRHVVRPGMPVEYEVEQGDRGLKVASVRVLAPAAAKAPTAVKAPVDGEPRARIVAGGDDDGMCDVLAPDELMTELTEVLIQHVPSLTGAQIAQVRQRVVELARSHGWAES